MKLDISFAVFLFVMFAVSNGGNRVEIPGKTFCPHDKITDWSESNSTTLCWDCQVCPRSWGSTFSCGDLKKHSSEKPIKCEKCVKGMTFSDSRSTDKCKRCTVCQANRVVLHKCNRRKDTVCGGCVKGYYEHKHDLVGIKTCEQCSQCCGDGKDSQVKECIDQGLPSNQVCSFSDRQRCKVQRHRAPTKVVTKRRLANTTSRATKPPYELHRPSKPTMIDHSPKLRNFGNNNINTNTVNINLNAIVITLSLAVVVIIAIVAGYRCFFKKKKKKTVEIDEGANEPLRGDEQPQEDNEEESVELSQSQLRNHIVNLDVENEPTNQPANDPANDPANQPANQPANDPANEPANQPASQPAIEPASQSPTHIELQPMQASSVQESTTVVEYLEDNARHSQIEFKNICHEMDNPEFKRVAKAVLCPLGVPQNEVYLYLKESGNFETLLEHFGCEVRDKTLEEIAEAFECPGARRNDLAQWMREEDRRMQAKKETATRTESQDTGKDK